MKDFKVDRFTAEAIIRALTGGRTPSRGDTIKLEVQDDGSGLGWIFSPVGEGGNGNGTSGEVNWNDVIGKPGTFPPSSHIHATNLVVIDYGTNPVPARVSGYLHTLWLGEADPGANAIDGDFWASV